MMRVPVPEEMLQDAGEEQPGFIRGQRTHELQRGKAVAEAHKRRRLRDGGGGGAGQAAMQDCTSAYAVASATSVGGMPVL